MESQSGDAAGLRRMLQLPASELSRRQPYLAGVVTSAQSSLRKAINAVNTKKERYTLGGHESATNHSCSNRQKLRIPYATAFLADFSVRQTPTQYAVASQNAPRRFDQPMWPPTATGHHSPLAFAAVPATAASAGKA
jgi:hypothetical protein